jgi:crotonobetainyl-CoA:carnitine CoA-transferase CaiB-like acyl-CoA transferase
MAVPLLWQDYGGKAPKRLGLAHPSICPYGAFKTADGKIILISIQNEREWKRFCTDILEDSDYSAKFPDNQTRVKNRKEVDDFVNRIISQMLHSDAVAKMKKSEIAFGTLNNVQDFSNHPVLRRAVISMADAEIEIPSPPAIFDNKPTKIIGKVPELNQHGIKIRAEFSKIES